MTDLPDATPPGMTEIASGALRVRGADLGAEMQSLTGADGREFLWDGQEAWWSGRAPILFPIVGRAPEDVISVGGAQAEMKQHGFARRAVFDLVEATAQRVVHRLTDSAETRAVYPRAFALTVTHEVAEATLHVSAQVANTGDLDLPFGLGFHPAFRWPLPGAGGAHRLILDNGGEPALARLRDGLLQEARMPSPFRHGQLWLDPALFEADAMIFPEGAGAGLTYRAETGPALRFAFDNAPFLGIWQKPGAPFICIEPWHGMAARQDAGPEIEARPGTVTLAPGDSARFGYSVTIA